LPAGDAERVSCAGVGILFGHKGSQRRLLALALAGTFVSAGACNDPSSRGAGEGLLDGTGGLGTVGLDDGTGGAQSLGTTGGEEGSEADDAVDSPGPEPTDDGDGESSSGEPPPDCSPAWNTPWIGSPCDSDDDCSYPDGECLHEADGFPCGTCSLPCDTLCRDTEGAPTTYCIDGAHVGLNSAGQCLSQCDTDLLAGDGCRDAYVCNVVERFDGTGTAPVCIPEDFGVMGDFVDEIDHEFLIDHLGGDPVDAFDYDEDVEGLQMYLDDVGVEYFTAFEIVEPNNPDAAAMCGLSVLLPPRDQWEKIGALAMFSDVLRDLVGEPIIMRNWWRPPCYNDAVGGAAEGDHPDADAVDLDFASPQSRGLAQGLLCDMYWAQDIVPPELIAPGSGLDPRLNLSVGLGGVTIHLGLLSEGGRRYWTYASYTEEPGSGDCW